MRQSFRRAGLLAMAFLVTLAGMVFVTGTASAARTRQTLDVRSVTQACPASASACARDVRQVDAGQAVNTYCVHPNNQLNLTYTGPVTAPGRGGYIPVTNFEGDARNSQLCNSAGSLAQPEVDTILGSCSGPCVIFSTDVREGEQLRAFCHLPPNNPEWLLVYVSRDGFAGFVEVDDLDPRFTPSVPSCNE
jgi:hypothetical protein